VVALALTGCAQQTPAPDTTGSPVQVDQRLSDLERRMERLESRPPVQVPSRSKAEIESQVTWLEGERDKLLLKYTEQHPAIRDIDRQLRILHIQLKMLEQ